MSPNAHANGRDDVTPLPILTTLSDMRVLVGVRLDLAVSMV